MYRYNLKIQITNYHGHTNAWKGVPVLVEMGILNNIVKPVVVLDITVF
jgi:hypothetical protein